MSNLGFYIPFTVNICFEQAVSQQQPMKLRARCKGKKALKNGYLFMLFYFLNKSVK